MYKPLSQHLDLQSSFFKFDLIILASSLRMTQVPKYDYPNEYLYERKHGSFERPSMNYPWNIMNLIILCFQPPNKFIFFILDYVIVGRCKTNKGHGLGCI